MKYTRSGGLDISLFSLGTVQLGMDYGINNPQGMPGREASFKILDTALQLGVNSLDTAVGYGDSERLIGEWLESVPPAARPLITTKVDRLDTSSGATLRASLRDSAEVSRKRLGLERIPLLMVHNFEQYAQAPDEVRRAFEELRAEGRAVGMLRLRTIWPFPDEVFLRLAERLSAMVVVEHNNGQLCREAERAVHGRCAVYHLGKVNGTVIRPQEIVSYIREVGHAV